MNNNPSHTDLKQFGGFVKKQRKGKGMSQEKLGLEANSYASTVQRIESGESNPKLSTLIALAEALDIDLCELMSYRQGGCLLKQKPAAENCICSNSNEDE